MIIKTHTKETVWYERIYDVPDDMSVDEIKDKIDSGELDSIEGEYLLDTAEEMCPSENDNQSTFEIIKNGETIYQNGL